MHAPSLSGGVAGNSWYNRAAAGQSGAGAGWSAWGVGAGAGYSTEGQFTFEFDIILNNCNFLIIRSYLW